MSLDERHHVTETDLFPAFALRSCQLTQSSPLPTSCSAPQLLSTVSSLDLGNRLDLTAPVAAFIKPAFSRCFTSTSGVKRIGASLVLPKGLIGAHLWVDCLPGGSFASKLVAGVGGFWIAPPSQRKAAVRIVSVP